MKKFIRNNIFGFILGGLIFGGIGIYAVSYYAKDVTYTPGDKTWEVSNVEEALNSLYENKSSSSNLNYITEATTLDYNTSAISTTITTTQEIKRGLLVVGSSTYTDSAAWPVHNGFTCTSTSGKVTLLRQTAGNIYYGIYGVATYLLENIPSGATITFGVTQSKANSYNYVYGQLYSLD